MKEKEYSEIAEDEAVDKDLLDPHRLKEQAERLIRKGHEPSEAKMLSEKTGEQGELEKE